MKTGKILPFFILLLGSFTIIHTFHLATSQSKLIGINFQGLNPENEKIPWNLLILKEGAKWKNISPSKDQFDWKLIEQASQMARERGILFKVDFQVSSAQLSNWLTENNKNRQSPFEHEHMSLQIEKVCMKYQKPDLISLIGENLSIMSKIAEQFSKYCPNTRLLISFKDEKQLSEILSNEYLELLELKEKRFIEGIEISLDQRRISLSSLEMIVQELGEMGIPIYVSGLSVHKNDSKLLEKIIKFLYSNIYVRGITFDYAKNLEDSDTKDNWLKIKDWLGLNDFTSLKTDFLTTYEENGMEEFGVMNPSHQNVRLLAITASFSRTVTKWTLKCDSTASTSSKPIVSYFWNWGDGTNNTITNGTKIAFHTYATAVTVTVSLTITDDAGGTDIVSYSVKIVGNVVPTAAFTSTVTAYTVAGTSTSTDSDGTIVAYEWNWGDNTTFDTTAAPSHNYILAGTYTITLKVTDEDGGVSVPKTGTVTVPSAAALPVPRFVFTINKLSVTFDASTSTDDFGTITSYFWTYNDGTTETTTVPTVTHVFPSAKNYNIILQVTNNRTAKASLQKTITTVNNVAPTSVAPVLTITGYNVSASTTSSDSDGTITDYKWGWGDTTANTTTSVSSATHSFTKAGTYTITLAVVDNDGATSTVKSVSVTVPSPLPTANFASYVDKLFVTFDASPSISNYGAIVNYAWNFGNAIKQNSTTPIITQTYSSAKSWNVNLVITDDKGATDSVTIAVVTNNNSLPVANFNTPTPNGYTVNVVSTSTDADGTIASYRWNWGDGTNNDTTASASHTYTTAGTYTITLNVVDNSSATSLPKTTQVTVPSSPPVASFTTNVSQLVVAFNASASTSAFGTITSYTWDFGDTTTQTTTGSTVSRTYAAVGTYTVTLLITDNKGAKGTLSKSVVTFANAVPVANFNVVSLSGYTANLASISTDSDGTIASYKWSWGDNTSNDTVASPTHTYTQAGTYTISLTVVDNNGSSSLVKTSTVTVPTVLPVSSFTTTVNKMSISFDGSSSTNQFGSITSYVWNFGDSNTVTTTIPTTTHTYTTVGTFTVTMKVVDNKNAQATSTKTVTTVANVGPTSNFDVSSLTGYTVNVASTSTDTDGTIALYKWSWGDNTANSTTSTSTHTFTQAGTYTISLTVVDNDGATSSAKTSTVTVPTVLPISAFTTSVDKLSVSFDASTSTDQFGTITSYVWNFGDTNTVTTTTPTTTHVYTTVGTFTVSLKIIDNKNAQATSSKTVTTVANNPPVASFNIASQSGFTVNVLSTSTDSDGTISVYQWNWGDGTANDTGSSASHIYNKVGAYEIKLSVKDNNGDWSSVVSYWVTVPDANSIPVAQFTITVNQFVVAVDGSTSNDPSGNTITSYTWNWGDGNTQTKNVPTATHTYLTTDLFVISLQVTSNKGAISKETQKSVNARSQTGLYPAWRWQNMYVKRTVNEFKYFMSTSRWQGNDGNIKYYHYFSKTS